MKWPGAKALARPIDGRGKTECIRKWIILAIIIFVLIVIYAKSDDTPESEITAIVEAADSGGPSAKQKLLQCFDNGLTAEKHNEIRRKIYLPKAQNGDANAQYWLGLIAANMSERLARWTKAAENGNTEAMEGLYWGSDDLGVDKEKARYWLVKAAESNPKAMVSLALKYCVGKRTDEALALCIKAGDMSCGQTKVEADRLTAQIYGDVSFAGYDPEKQKAYLLKALNVKPAPTDNGFDDECAQAASLLSQERNTNSPSESNVKNAAYCAAIAAVLDRDYADRLSEFAIRQSESDAWAVDARNYNFQLPC